MITDDGYKATKDGYKKIGVSFFNYRFWKGYYEKRTATDGCYVSVSKIALLFEGWRRKSKADKRDIISNIFLAMAALVVISSMIGGFAFALVHLIKSL